MPAASSILSGIRRIKLGHTPTPLERLDRLTRELGGPEIWIKRDDCTGLATGGNKTRKLEFLVADALASGCDTLVTVGKLQSNHARQTAAAAAKVGMSCVLLLERLAVNDTDLYARNGNALLNRLLGAEIVELAPGERTPAFTDAYLAELRADGSQPYFVPVGGSDAVGSIGYAACGIELDTQLIDLGLDAQHVILATGSGGTQAGMVIGLAAAQRSMSTLGFSVSDRAGVQAEKVIGVIGECSVRLGIPAPDPSLVLVEDDTLGPGYGQPDGQTIEAIELFARTEGIILDPVYTGKAAAGLIAGCRSGRFGANERVIFLHTGGQAGAFAYEGTL